MFSNSQRIRKSGDVSLLNAGILPVDSAAIDAAIAAGTFQGLVVPIQNNLDMHQGEISCRDTAGVITGGSIAVLAKSAAHNADWQAVQKDGADYVLNLSTGLRSFELPNSSISQIAVVPTVEITVSAGTEWSLNTISGRKG